MNDVPALEADKSCPHAATGNNRRPLQNEGVLPSPIVGAFNCQSFFKLLRGSLFIAKQIMELSFSRPFADTSGSRKIEGPVRTYSLRPAAVRAGQANIGTLSSVLDL